MFVEQAKTLEPRFLTHGHSVAVVRWRQGARRVPRDDAQRRPRARARRLPEAQRRLSRRGHQGRRLLLPLGPRQRRRRATCHDAFEDGEVIGPTRRTLDEFDVFVRDQRGLCDPARRSWQLRDEPSIDTVLARDKAFGLDLELRRLPRDASDRATCRSTTCRSTKRARGLHRARRRHRRATHLIDKWKVFVPKAGSGRERSDSGVDLVLGQPSLLGDRRRSALRRTSSLGPFDVESEARELSSRTTRRGSSASSSRCARSAQDATHAASTRWCPMQTWDRDVDRRGALREVRHHRG